MSVLFRKTFASLAVIALLLLIPLLLNAFAMAVAFTFSGPVIWTAISLITGMPTLVSILSVKDYYLALAALALATAAVSTLALREMIASHHLRRWSGMLRYFFKRWSLCGWTTQSQLAGLGFTIR